MDCEWIGWCALKPEAQAAWVQAIGSIGAILAAVWIANRQAMQARRFVEEQRAADLDSRRKLATPHLWIERFVQREAPQLRLLLHNDGVGPAFVKRFQVFVDGIPVDFARQTYWLDVLRELELPAAVNSGGTLMGDGKVVAAGAEIQLLRYQPEEPSLATNAILHAQSDRIEFDIQYESLFGEQYTYGDVGS